MIGREIAALRHASGLTQEKLAERAGVSVDVIRRLEQGQRRTARIATLQAIATALDTRVSIGFAGRAARESTPDDPDHDKNGSCLSRDVEASAMDRRELLRLITAATAVIGASSADADLDRLTARGPGRLGQAALAELAALNTGLWAGFVMAHVKADVVPAVWNQIRRLTEAMRRPQSTVVRRRLCVLSADVFQLAGELLFDANRYAEAGHCYTLAATSAREAHAMDLWSCALTRLAYISVYEQRFADAVPLLDLSRGLARKGDSEMGTGNWAAAVQTQAFAGLGDQAACELALEQAEQVRGLARPSNGGWLRFDGSRLAEDRASCYVHQRRPELAEPILLGLLKNHPSGRRRGIALVDLATVSAQRPDVLRLVSYGAAAVDHTRQTESGVVLRKLQNLRSELVLFQRDPHVRALDSEIAHLTVAPH